MNKISCCLATMLLALAGSAGAAEPPHSATPQSATWTAPSFTFHTGETLPDLKLHYLTLGDPRNPAVLVLHGTAGSGASMTVETFGGQLFGPGQPLDAAKYFIVLPDAIGAGDSAKPSDGLRARFPQYDYADMVLGQYRLLTEGLDIHHLRLVIGNSMGGMQTWVWGEAHPDMMDALVPMASQPTAMSARNWMMRLALVESIRQDPAWNHGDYIAQPPSLRLANVMFGIATSGGTLAFQALAPTNAQATRLVQDRLAAPLPGDANDFIYQWAASADYDAAPGLTQIHAAVLAINSADDERNPPETGTMTRSLARLPGARLLLIPASAETRGHGTTGFAKFYAAELGAFLAGLPPNPG